MKTKDIEAYLEQMETDAIKMRISGELKYRTVSSQVMVTKGKEMESLMAMQTQTTRENKMMDANLRQLRALREQVTKGEYTV